LTSLPIHSGPDGVVQDYLLEFRLYLNELLVPIAWLILGAGILITTGFPLLFYFNLVKPLRSLLDGVRKMESGSLDTQVPVQYKDEIGSLTNSFNGMATQLRSLVTDLDVRVAARTEELTAANEQLKTRLEEIKVLQEQLREQAIRDPLTSLFNRRYLQEMMELEIAQAERQGWKIGVIMMDIDHYKLVNDTYGHQMGDRVLQELGKLILSKVRKGDIACRFGGEEFLIILPNAPLENTLQRANEIRSAFEEMSRMILKHSDIHLTLSAGVVVYPTQGLDYDTLLKNADSALYFAKNLGRNRAETIGAE
jgi:diguanylate cyclase (GGDEF)-like protein